jgi:hypothetical protein
MKKTNKMGTTKRRYIGKGRRKQKGELSLVEAAGVMAAAAHRARRVHGPWLRDGPDPRDAIQERSAVLRQRYSRRHRGRDRFLERHDARLRKIERSTPLGVA